MADIVVGIASSHTPQLSSGVDMWPDHAERDRRNPWLLGKDARYHTYEELLALAPPGLDPELAPDVWEGKYSRCQYAIASLAETLRAARADVALIIGDDQREMFLNDGIPAFACFAGSLLVDMRPGAEAFARIPAGIRAAYWAVHGDEPGRHPVADDLSMYVASCLTADGFDLTLLTEQPAGRTLGHAFTFPRYRLGLTEDTPVVPVFVNTYYQPNVPSAARCYALGQALRRAVSSWDSETRVAVVASGGLSHFVVDEELDRSVLAALVSRDASALRALSRDRLRSGNSEILNWVTAAGALEGLTATVLDYVPGYRTPAGTGAGMAFARWLLPADRLLAESERLLYNGVPVLDVHGHVSVPFGANSFLMLMMGSNTPMPSPIGEDPAGPGRVTIEDFRAAAAGHARYMDERNIDVQVIGPRPFLTMGWMEPHLLPAWARYVNDMIRQQCEMFPDRFLGAAMLPQDSAAPDLSGCLDELDRVVREYGFAAAYVSPDPAGRRTTPGMHEPYWFPLYARAQELDIPLIVHGTNSLDPRYRVVPHNYQLGFMTEQYLAGQFLSHGDVFTRYPELKVIVCHCGGALDRFIPTDHHIAQKDLAQNLFYDTCGYDLNFLEAAIKQRGVSRMLFGTEAPGSGRAVRPETGRTSDDLVPVIGEFGFLSEADKVAIFNENPARVIPALAKAHG